MPNYRYNGREMPELPNGSYPYWFIMENKYVPENPILVNSKYPLYRHVFDDGSSTNRYTEKSHYSSYTITDGAWSHATSGGPTEIEKYGLPVIWTNHDILYEDGSVYLKASDPVPVTTPQDFYIVKNGVGQKQDVYLRVGGQWVKQDEYVT